MFRKELLPIDLDADYDLENFIFRRCILICKLTLDVISRFERKMTVKAM